MNDYTSAIQDISFPDNVCFCCGSAHPTGLHIKSYWDPDGIHVICRYTPLPEFVGYPGLVYGGLIAMLIDCHAGWTAMAYHYRAEGREPDSLPRIDCVTGNMNITYRKPTQMGVELTLRAKVVGDVGRKSRVVCEVWAGDVMTVSADTVFFRVDTKQLHAAAQQKV